MGKRVEVEKLVEQWENLESQEKQEIEKSIEKVDQERKKPLNELNTLDAGKELTADKIINDILPKIYVSDFKTWLNDSNRDKKLLTELDSNESINKIENTITDLNKAKAFIYIIHEANKTANPVVSKIDIYAKDLNRLFDVLQGNSLRNNEDFKKFKDTGEGKRLYNKLKMNLLQGYSLEQWLNLFNAYFTNKQLAPNKIEKLIRLFEEIKDKEDKVFTQYINDAILALDKRKRSLT